MSRTKTLSELSWGLQTLAPLLLISMLAWFSSMRSSAGEMESTTSQTKSEICEEILRIDEINIPEVPGIASNSGIPIWFNKEMLITDPTQLCLIKESDFNSVIQDLNVTNNLTSLLQEFHDNRGVYPKQALSEYTMELIAVVNRIDLVEPEGRLIFQARTPKTHSFEDITFILEYKLYNQNKNQKDAAKEWHRLGTLEGDDYHELFQSIVTEFTQKGNFLRLRTNIKTNRDYSFNEVEILKTNNNRVWKMKAPKKSPGDWYSIPGEFEKLINEISENPLDAIFSKKNILDLNDKNLPQFFDLLAGLDKFKDLNVSIPNSGILMNDINSDNAYIIKANSCNGCHSLMSDVDAINNTDESLLLIHRISALKPAIISNTLLSDFIIEAPFSIPECRRGISQTPTIKTACTYDETTKNLYWNEKQNRINVMASHISQNTIKTFVTSLFLGEQQPGGIQVYRVH